MKIAYISIALALAILLLSGCVQPTPEPTPTPSPGPIVGGDRDEHGCIPSAGYEWCEAKQKCIRQWEEDCEEPKTLEEIAETFCNTPQVEAIYVCGTHIKVVSSLIGGGSTYYTVENGELDEGTQCPVVAPDAMSEECTLLTMGSNCIETQIC